MTMVTPTLNLPQPPASSTKASAPAAAAVATPAAPAPAPSAPSSVVSLSPQALSAAYAASHPTASSSSSPPASTAAAPAAPLPAAHDGSLYDALKHGISSAVTDVGDAIAAGAHAVVDGVETTLSTANDVVKGTLELPFAAVSKGCDAVGALIDEL
jgi:hypothetical protein